MAVPEGADPVADFTPHLQMVAQEFANGYVVPFLGAGANLCGRTEPKWAPGKALPSGAELAEHLAASCAYPYDDVDNLVRVSQYHATTKGAGPLYSELRTVFDQDYPPTPLHSLLAALPKLLAERGRLRRYPLIVTTNYDDALESAFQTAEEPFDLVSYMATGSNRGRFVHTGPDGKAQLIDRPNKYKDLSLDDRTVILKIHGAVDRHERRRDSFVITEDHYIDYLTRTELASLVPVTLVEVLSETHFLFLGYSMRDWNLRVILHRIWQEQEDLPWEHWAVQLVVDDLDRKFWGRRGIEILELDLGDYVRGLAAEVRKLEPAPAPARP